MIAPPLVLSLVLLFGLPAPTRAQTIVWLQDLDWYEPLIAEPRAARISVLFPAWSDAFEFSLEPGRRLVWDITLGKEIPIVGFKSGGLPHEFTKGQWAIGVWTPVAFHMIEDHVDPSSPIVNTDYRFGSMIKARIGISRREHTLGFRVVPYAHESTHLGDEFTLQARETFPQFERINVSYEYWEAAASLDAPAWTVRAGMLQPWGGDGYYSAELLELSPRRDRVPTSRNNLEPYAGLEYRHPDTILAWNEMAFFASADLRHKAVYDYRKADDDVKEDKQLSTNLLVGLRSKPGLGRLALTEIYVRFYHGVNPAGQLRDQRDYTLIGVGFNFGVRADR
ncbi:MAG: DUF1207 domain-containing protein [Acidobacteria bacterium]|nr:DUF1207 domain-containing protein [Acidobacteriota bacterium]